MSLKDVCEFLQLSYEHGNGKRLLKDLLRFNVKVDGSKRYLLKYITVEDSESKNDYFVVNPQVIWSGKDIDNIKNLLDKLFFN